MALSAKDRKEIGLYRQTGRQDCGNTISISDFDFDIPGATADEIVDAYDLENNFGFEDWIDQFEDVPKHIERECYEAWLDGWNECAVSHVEDELRDRQKRHDLYYLMTGGVDWEGRHTGGEVVEKTADFDEAMTMLAAFGDRREKATLFLGNALDGPQNMVAYIGIGFYPVGTAGYKADVMEWREKYRDPVVKKPIKTNPLERIPGGKAAGKSPRDFDPRQLAIGTKVELEHTNDRAIAREIAMDHLAEDSAYYTKLRKVHVNPIDPVRVYWLVTDVADPFDALHAKDMEVIERFDDFEDAVVELAKLPVEQKPGIIEGETIYQDDRRDAYGRVFGMSRIAAYRSRVDGMIFGAGSVKNQDTIFRMREEGKLSGLQSPVHRLMKDAKMRKNPTEDTKRAAVGKYKEFWRQEPTKIGEFPASFKIPGRVHKLGRAVNVLYESKKTDPETLKKPGKPLAYIHEHDAGVHIHDLHGEMDTEVPDFIKHAQALVCLGQCLGFAWWDEEGDEHEAEATDPLPDLWCTVDGRALLVIQSRRTVLQIVWGGGLGVEARGIVG